jgi:hypothetical protein
MGRLILLLAFAYVSPVQGEGREKDWRNKTLRVKGQFSSGATGTLNAALNCGPTCGQYLALDN